MLPAMKRSSLWNYKRYSEVEFKDLSDSNLDLFETMYGEMDENSFHQMMEVNDWTYSPLFSDKEFLNEGWHKHTCTETCAAIVNARHGCESLLGQIFKVSGKLMTQVVTLLYEIGNMVTNMTGNSILKSTSHTGWVKPVNLSVRFILGDGEQYSNDFSDSESEI